MNTRYAITEKAAAAGSGRAWRFTITSGAPDSEGDRVNIDGLDLTRFSANPVAIWAHAHKSFPIGQWRNVQKIGRGFDGRITAELHLVSEGTVPEADTVAKLISDGVLRGASIGFLPLESTPNAYGGYDHLRAELIEASVVSIPANPEALIAAGFGGYRGNATVVLPDLLPSGVSATTTAQELVDAARGAVERVFRQFVEAAAPPSVKTMLVRAATAARLAMLERRSAGALSAADLETIRALIEGIEAAAEQIETLLGLAEESATAPDGGAASRPLPWPFPRPASNPE